MFEMERLRCNACGQVFTADEPETAGPDKYDETAMAMIAVLKYGTGVPFQRLERLQGQLGMPVAAATQWELVQAAAKRIRPALQELVRQAAQGSVLHNDDTGMRILRLAREPGDRRTGTFTSGVVSIVGAFRIALYFTGWKHAGENLADVLKQRTRELPAPIQMSDALSRNTPQLEGVKILPANCLAHYLDSGIIWSCRPNGVPDGVDKQRGGHRPPDNTAQSFSRNARSFGEGLHRRRVRSVRPERFQKASSTSRFILRLVVMYRLVVATEACPR